MSDAKIIGWLLAMQGLVRKVPAMASDSDPCQQLGNHGHRLAVTEHKIVGRENSATSCLSVDR